MKRIKGEQKREAEEMNSIFSIDDFSDPFWESSPPLDSDSAKVVTAEEWTVEMFLEEIASSVSSEPVGNNNDKNNNAIVGVSSAQSLPSVSGQNDFEEDSRFRRDSDECRRVLENKLETECATVVALRVSIFCLPSFLVSCIACIRRRCESCKLCCAGWFCEA